MARGDASCARAARARRRGGAGRSEDHARRCAVVDGAPGAVRERRRRGGVDRARRRLGAHARRRGRGSRARGGALMSPRIKAALLLAGVFLAGAGTGGAVTIKLTTRRIAELFEGEPRRVLPRLYGEALERRLHTTAAQRAE